MRRISGSRALRVAATLIVYFQVSHAARSAEPMPIAPVLSGGQACLEGIEKKLGSKEEIIQYCLANGFSPSSLIERTLEQIGPKLSKDGKYALGYTLILRLFDLVREASGSWVPDEAAIKFLIRPVAEIDRPVVVHLSADHFASAANASLLKTLAADPVNLQATREGAASADKYYNVNINPWTIDNLDAPVTRVKQIALRAALKALCELPSSARSRIAAIDLLGETHYIWPDFFSGMGYDRPFRPTDYSPPSVVQFRAWLRAKFEDDLSRLNLIVGASYSSFDDVAPPSKDIRTEKLDGFQEHLDAFAHGTVPVFGWAHDARGSPLKVAVFVDGAHYATVDVDLNRPDVMDAKPEFKTPLVGFRYDLDFSRLPPGIHTLEVFVLPAKHKPLLLARNSLVIVDQKQSNMGKVATFVPIDAMEMVSVPQISGYLDSPANLTSLFYNPLARLWLEFRNAQVRRYIRAFSDIAADSCFGRELLFSHQIVPRLNGSWNPELMAADQSLQPSRRYNLGVTLYGGAAFSPAFFHWLRAMGTSTYGVGEFNTMVPWTAMDLAAILERHRAAGARYIAPYFFSLVPEYETDTAHNRFWIAADRNEHGSSALYEAIRMVMSK